MAVGQVNFIPLYTNLIVCPLCGSPRVHRLLEAVRLSAEVDGDQVATGAVAWSCQENGHVFFLRESDLRKTLGREARSLEPQPEA
jgi:hypothetical protein